MYKRILSLFVALLMITSILISCSESTDVPASATTNAAETSEVTEYDPLAGLDFNKEEIRILTSTNDPGGVGNSNYLIEGPAEQTGDIVDDAVYSRNIAVEEKLNVDLIFTQVDLNYNEVAAYITKLVASGEDQYDIIIQDLFPSASLVITGSFINVLEGQYFDFTQDYWKYDCMTDLAIGHNAAYLMVGDFFIDTLRGSHALFFNKTLMTDLGMDSSELYSTVTDGNWTYDVFNTYITAGYQDLNGNAVKDEADQFGFVALQKWGPSIPFIVSGDPGFIERDSDGIPSITIYNDRAILLLDKINQVFWGDGSYNTLSNGQDLGDKAEEIFRNGNSLFLGYQRLGSLEDFRGMEDDISLVPYPKLDDAQEKYVTSMHDTTEVGMIPITATKLDVISAVLEELCRETNKTVLPAYYETALKVKYTRDDEASQMIDIIHDNVGNAFALAYDSSLGEILIKNIFYYNNLEKGENNLASSYAKLEKSGLAKMDSLTQKYLENNG